MIPKHQQFIDAIHQKKKVSVRFYSKADSGVVERVCAPLDYGPDATVVDGLNRYLLWDEANVTGDHHLSLVPKQIVDISVLGSVFDPAEFGTPDRSWTIPRNWGSQNLSGVIQDTKEKTQP